jgi:ACS family tartrate transporter-like MFS transporter
MDSTLEQLTMRRVALRIVPFIMLLYFVAYIDRVNIGFAALTMNKDLGFSPGGIWVRRRHLFLGLFSLRGALQHYPR